MQKFRNVIFVLVACAALFCCLGNKIADRVLHITDIPDQSYLEGRTYQQFPQLSREALLSGTFQNEAEQYVADLIPKRDSVLLANAKIQRAVIKCSNLVAGYQVYPTFFGSNYYCTSDGQHVIEAPGKTSYYNDSRFEAAANEYNKLFANNKDTQWCVFMPDRGASSSGSPLHGLTSNTIDYNALEQSFLSQFQGAKVLNSRIDSTQEFFEKRYSTDHHWNARGAVAGYNSIMYALNRTPIQFSGFQTVLNKGFYGSATRNGLCPTKGGEVVEDAVYTHGDIEVEINEKRAKLSDVDESWSKDGGKSYKKADRFTNVYGDYFHGDYAQLHYHNAKGAGSLLILGDSFTDCMDRFFAESYQDVWVLDPRHYEGSIQEFLDKHPIDDGLILMGCTNIMETEVYDHLN